MRLESLIYTLSLSLSLSLLAYIQLSACHMQFHRGEKQGEQLNTQKD